MAIIDSIQTARSRGASDDQILQMIEQQNPDKVASIREARNRGAAATQIISEITRQNTPEGDKGLKGFSTGFAKGGLNFLQNIGQATIAAPALIPGGKTYKERLSEVRQTTGIAPSILEPRGRAEKTGFFASEVAQFAAPQVGVAKAPVFAAKGFGALAKRSGIRALIGGGVATAQEGEIGAETAVAAGAEVILPGVAKVAGFTAKVAGNITRRLLKGLGANVDIISKNPQAVSHALRTLEKKTGPELVEVANKNAKEVVRGIARIRSEARAAYGAALKGLKKTTTDIPTLQRNVASTFGRHGLSVSDGRLVTDGAEFLSSTLRKRAANLANTVNKHSDTSGAGVTRLAKFIDDARFKTPGSNSDKLAFNAFVDDLEKQFRKSVPELANVNSKFSSQMQLAEVAEGAFGKVKFQNRKEVVAASEKMATALRKGGVAESEINKFLRRVGIDPLDFRAEQAVLTTVTEPLKAEKAGVGVGEFLRQATAGIMDPKTATRAAVALQKASDLQQSSFIQLLKESSAAQREIIIKSIIDLFGED